MRDLFEVFNGSRDSSRAGWKPLWEVSKPTTLRQAMILNLSRSIVMEPGAQPSALD